MRPGCFCRLLLLSLPQFTHHTFAEQSQSLLSDDIGHEHRPITISSDWDVLGPFRIGTREAVWGADPVEYHGGIQHTEPDVNSSFPSPLARNATVRWRRFSCDPLTLHNGSSVDLLLAFDEVDWNFAQKIYGWSAFQYQAWVKGHIVNHENTAHTVNLFTENILELWVNDLHIFGGDLFGFGRAPAVVELHPGKNDISVRLVREVRSMGGTFPPSIQASLCVQIASRALEVVTSSIVLPDVIDGRLSSPYGSIIVRNQAQTPLTVQQLTAHSDGEIIGIMYRKTRLAAGQSRPLQMMFEVAHELDKALDFVLIYSGDTPGLHQVSFSVQLQHTDRAQLHRFTFVHPSGVVSYATLRPPPLAAKPAHAHLPILLNLHGAGVEAGGSLARHMFDDAPDLPAWILTPTGMSPWSSDDWHIWGSLDAQAAVLAVHDWIANAGWNASGVYTEKLLVAGHSNGGQGAWYAATHQPDRILGVAALSGYSSIENYVPYVMWTEADALQDAVLQISRASFRHELLVENLQGIPIFQQHGSVDDNVPVYHARLMNNLLAQSGSIAKYSELPEGGHWFDGAMTTKPMIDFYTQHLNISHRNGKAPSSFVFVVPNSHDMGSKFGIVVDQLSTPDRMGRVAVNGISHNSRNSWYLETENIHRFHYDLNAHLLDPPDDIFIDGLPHAFSVGRGQTSFVRMEGGVWGLEVARNWKTLDQRYGRQRGVLDAILRSDGPFEVIYDLNNTLHTAVQVSRNFLQYYGADANLVAFFAYEEALEREGNVVSICLGTSVPNAHLAGYPIRIAKEQIILTRRDHRTISIPLAAGMGGVWLRPLPNERLELVVWGYDQVGLRQAARLIPTITGAGVPDFVILSNRARWEGHGGTVAMGFFDYNWQISPVSYVP